MPEKERVLFVCIENSCRSQMAEAFAHLYAHDSIEAYSAGSRPSGSVDPRAVAALAKLGYDMQGQHSKSLSEIPRFKYNYVITMGCGDECPFIPADYHFDWNIPDPKGLPDEEFHKTCDIIEQRVKELAARIEARRLAKK